MLWLASCLRMVGLSWLLNAPYWRLNTCSCFHIELLHCIGMHLSLLNECLWSIMVDKRATEDNASSFGMDYMFWFFSKIWKLSLYFSWKDKYFLMFAFLSLTPFFHYLLHALWLLIHTTKTWGFHFGNVMFCCMISSSMAEKVFIYQYSQCQSNLYFCFDSNKYTVFPTTFNKWSILLLYWLLYEAENINIDEKNSIYWGSLLSHSQCLF